jgi:hypothetical protein
MPKGRLVSGGFQFLSVFLVYLEDGEKGAMFIYACCV